MNQKSEGMETSIQCVEEVPFADVVEFQNRIRLFEPRLVPLFWRLTCLNLSAKAIMSPLPAIVP